MAISSPTPLRPSHLYELSADGRRLCRKLGLQSESNKLPNIFQVSAHSDVLSCPSPAGCRQSNIFANISGNAMLKHSFLPPNLVVRSLFPRKGL